MESLSGPDLSSGIPVDGVPDGGMLQGKVAGEDVVLARRGSEFSSCVMVFPLVERAFGPLISNVRSIN